MTNSINSFKLYLAQKIQLNWTALLFHLSDDHGKTIPLKISPKALSELIKKIQSGKLDPEKWDCHNKTLLIAAFEYAPNIILPLLKVGVNPNGVGKNNTTALMAAVTQYNTEVINQLLEFGAEAKTCDHHHQNVLFTFIPFQEILTALVEKGADINLVDKYGNTPLIACCGWSNEDFSRIDFYLKKGANINHQNHIGMTPLMMAVECKSLFNIQELLKYKPDLNLKNNNRKDVFDIINTDTFFPEEVKQSMLALLQNHELQKINMNDTQKKVKIL